MISRIRLGPDYDISRLIKGGWHLAGDHGAIDRDQALRDMAAFVEAGITTFDCADIYTDVEALIGEFRRRFPSHAGRIQVQTKFVPDLGRLDRIDRSYIESIIDRSLQRLGLETLDLVQFHWWNYDVPRYVDTALELDRLRRAGKIRRIGVTNFDLPRLTELLDAGVPVALHQLQYSLLDDRPRASGMARFCADHGIGLLCYGTIAGGFLSQRWLGEAEPAADLANRSLTKYKLIVDEFGGWRLFQTLLQVLARIAQKHGVEITSVAVRAILDRANVFAAIVGATSTRNLPAHVRTDALELDAEDLAAIDAVLSLRNGPAGDVYTLERDIDGPHGRIMKYNLNT
jgi:aryl-alcohol dehydrogenase-like predicted oxidoreductase